MLKSYKYRKTANIFLTYLMAFIVLIVFAAPFAWLVVASLQKESDLLSVVPQIIPEDPTLQNYKKLLYGQRFEEEQIDSGVRGYAVPREAKLFPKAIYNSFIVATLTTITCLIIGSLTAYALARLEFTGSKPMFFLVLASRMIPGLTLVIPFYLLANQLGMLDQKLTLIIVYSSFNLPYIIWILKGFFETIPPGLEEAARIDGCTRFQTIWKIILPISTPGLVGAGIFTFMLAWNEFFFALILTNTESAFTLPVISGMFATELDIDYSLMITSGVLSVVPPLIFTFVFQRYIIKGLTAGSVKG